MDLYLVPKEYGEELGLIRRTVREFGERYLTRERAREADRLEEFPWEIYREAGRLGLIAPTLPAEYGGGGFTNPLVGAVVAEELIRVEPTLGQAVLAGAFGMPLIYALGTEEQRRRYVPPVARGEKTCFFALTEPEHGSDATHLSTVAVRRDDRFVLNGRKIYITNAPTAEYGVVVAQTDPEKGYRGMTLFIVHTNWPGVEVRPLKGKMGQRASPIGEITLRDVEVPLENVLGGSERVGVGFYGAVQFLNAGRVGVATTVLGTMLAAFDRAFEYAQRRVQFGKPIIEHQLIQAKIAEMAQLIDLSRMAVYRAHLLLEGVGRGEVDPRTMAAISSITKTFVTESATRVLDHAIQILGGAGYFQDFDVERYWRDHRVSRIYEGTTEINLLTIVDMLRKGYFKL